MVCGLLCGVKCELCCEPRSSTEPTVSIVSDSFSGPASVPPVLIIIAPPSPSPPQQTQTLQSHHRHLGLYRLRLVLSELTYYFFPFSSWNISIYQNFLGFWPTMGNFWKKGDFFSFEKFEITLSSTYQGENYFL